MNQHVFLLDHEVGQPRENQDCYLNYTQNHAEPVGKNSISRTFCTDPSVGRIASIPRSTGETIRSSNISSSFSPG